MTSVPECNGAVHRYWKEDVQKGTGRVVSCFMAAAPETMKVEYPARGSSKRKFVQLGDLDFRGIESVTYIHSGPLDEAPKLARVAGGLQVACRQERRGAPPPGRASEDACASGKICRLAETLQGKPPLPCAGDFGLTVFRSLSRRQPEARDAIELGAYVAVDTARDEH